MHVWFDHLRYTISLYFRIEEGGGHMGGHLIQYDKRFILFCKNVSNSIIIIEKFKIEFRSKMDIWLSNLVSTWHLKWGNQHFSFHWKKKVGWYSLYSIFNLPKRSMFEKNQKIIKFVILIKNGGSTVVPKNQPLESDWAKKLTKKDTRLIFFSS